MRNIEILKEEIFAKRKILNNHSPRLKQNLNKKMINKKGMLRLAKVPENLDP